MINHFLLGFSFIFALTGAMISAPQSAQALPDLQDRKILPRSLDGMINSPNNQQDTLSQITNVSELRDIQPTDWAYEALKSLVERYGCIVGYPDRTFRGVAEGTLRDRALSRWEFAAGLNACLNTMERLLQENVAVLRTDLDKLKRLTGEFRQELAALGVRVDNLEQRTAFLEDHVFSTTNNL